MNNTTALGSDFQFGTLCGVTLWLSILSFILNTYIVVLFVWFQEMKTPRNILVMNIVSADLLRTLISTLPTVVVAIRHTLGFRGYNCWFHGICSVLTRYVTLFTMLYFACTRSKHIRNFNQTVEFERRVAIFNTKVIWGSSIAITFVGVLLSAYVSENSNSCLIIWFDSQSIVAAMYEIFFIGSIFYIFAYIGLLHFRTHCTVRLRSELHLKDNYSQMYFLTTVILLVVFNLPFCTEQLVCILQNQIVFDPMDMAFSLVVSQLCQLWHPILFWYNNEQFIRISHGINPPPPPNVPQVPDPHVDDEEEDLPNWKRFIFERCALEANVPLDNDIDVMDIEDEVMVVELEHQQPPVQGDVVGASLEEMERSVDASQQAVGVQQARDLQQREMLDGIVEERKIDRAKEGRKRPGEDWVKRKSEEWAREERDRERVRERVREERARERERVIEENARERERVIDERAIEEKARARERVREENARERERGIEERAREEKARERERVREEKARERERVKEERAREQRAREQRGRVLEEAVTQGYQRVWSRDGLEDFLAGLVTTALREIETFTDEYLEHTQPVVQQQPMSDDIVDERERERAREEREREMAREERERERAREEREIEMAREERERERTREERERERARVERENFLNSIVSRAVNEAQAFSDRFEQLFEHQQQQEHDTQQQPMSDNTVEERRNEYTQNFLNAIVTRAQEEISAFSASFEQQFGHHQLQESDFEQEIEPVVQQQIEPVVQQQIEPVVQQQVEPVVQQQIEPVVQQQIEPVFQQQIEPVVQQQIEPVVQQQVEPVVQQQIEPVVQQQIEPVFQQQIEPVVQQQIEPVVQQQPTPGTENPDPHVTSDDLTEIVFRDDASP